MPSHPATVLANAGYDPRGLQVLYDAGFKLLGPAELTQEDDPPIPDEVYEASPAHYEKFGSKPPSRTLAIEATVYDQIPQVISGRQTIARYLINAGRGDYLAHIKRQMLREFADKLVEVLGIHA